MRFDDMIATVLDRPFRHQSQRAAEWRQLVDLLAQGRHRDGGPQVERAFAFLREHRGDVPLALRTATAAGMSGLRIDPRLVRFFAEDHPSVSSELLRGARLESSEWIDLLPSLTPTGRAILRHRRDLPPSVADALASFGPNDFVIEGSVEEPAAETQGPAATIAPPPAEPAPSQIRELVDRIEAFQRHREEEDQHQAAEAPRADTFRWETGTEGVILWVDGAPRGPLVGQSIATIGEQGRFGVDGQAAGAFHKRAPFRDARFTVAGDGPAAGGWRISAVPFFDVHRGNFLGYRGTARRPRFDEVAPMPGSEPDGLFGSDLAPDSLRQLVHELRTPLNAIIGFAEMIEGQYMGPAGANYRGRATEIVAQAQRLLGAVDDLDTAARIETSRLDLSPAQIDAAAMLERLGRACTPDCERIETRVAPGLPPAAIEPAAAERMISRLLAATIGLAAPEEVIRADLGAASLAGRPVLRLALDRPQTIAGLDEMQLLHPGYTPEGDWPGAPSLGLGFALRLVRKLAEAAGGALEVNDDSFTLTMPAAVQRIDGADEESA